MKVIVLGAGVVGVTSAWYLAQAGHEVVVIERQRGVARETSFANAGEISPGYASPWAAPGIPLKALRWLFMRHAPLVIRPELSVEMLRWLCEMLFNCTTRKYAVNKRRMMGIAQFSQARLAELRSDLELNYDQRALGTLQLFRNARQVDGIARDLTVLEEYGVSYELLNTAGCIAAEPGLGHSEASFVGGLRLPGDETGDCFAFTEALAARAMRRGVTFKYGCNIERLIADSDRIAALQTSAGALKADAYLLACGSFSTLLVRDIGLRLPVYPVKGYSITVPVLDASSAPVSTLLDETHKVAITRLGDRIRVGGIAEISGYNSDLPNRRRATLEHCLSSLFPRGGAIQMGSFWSGLRPMTPDSAPIIGGTRFQNLFLNTGHGTLGWTMACGSGHVIADIISGRCPSINAHDLSLDRY